MLSKILFAVGVLVMGICLITDGPAFFAGAALTAAGIVGIIVKG